jgi:hypothetical protein
VYNYKNEAVEILGIGRTVKQSIANAIKLWGGEVNSFDLIYTRVGKNKEDTKYSTAQVPRLKKLPTDLVLYDLGKILKPTPIEKIIEILEGKIQEKTNNETQEKVNGAITEPNKTIPPVVNKTTEDINVIEDDGGIDLDKLIEDDK